jgi:hypothetical protein
MDDRERLAREAPRALGRAAEVHSHQPDAGPLYSRGPAPVRSVSPVPSRAAIKSSRGRHSGALDTPFPSSALPTPPVADELVVDRQQDTM